MARKSKPVPEIIAVITNRSLAACIAVLSIAVQSFAAGQTATNDSVRMNQIQVIGTHNSYHAGLAPSEAKLMMAKNPKVYQDFDYRSTCQPLIACLTIVRGTRWSG
jgi:hypothetical protein